MKLGSGLNAIRSTILAHAATPETERKERLHKWPVVTISREAGTNASEVTTELVRLLSERDDPKNPWQKYDSELVNRVAEDHDLSEHLIAAVQERDKSWIEHFAAGLTSTPTDIEIAMKIAKTIRGIAAVGRAVIVGRGGQAILNGVPQVIHVRLRAPVEWRVQQHAESHKLDIEKAREEVSRIDNERTRFVKNHFNRDPHDPDLYDLIINMKQVDVKQAARVILTLVPKP